MTSQPPPTDADMAWFGFFVEVRRLAALARARRAAREQAEEVRGETPLKKPDIMPNVVSPGPRRPLPSPLNAQGAPTTGIHGVSRADTFITASFASPGAA